MIHVGGTRASCACLSAWDDQAGLRHAAAGGRPRGLAIVGLATGSDRHEAAGIMVQDPASALFGVEGLQVTGVGLARTAALRCGGHRLPGRGGVPGVRRGL